MALVVDASVGVKWFLAEPLHDEARALLLGAEGVAAPDLFLPEVANVLWRKQRAGELMADEASAVMTALSAGTPALHPSAGLVPRALDLAVSLDHAVYDCVYLVLAVDLGGVFVTADDRFLRKARAGGHRDRVRHLRPSRR